MTTNEILLTGGTGSLGASVLDQLLSQGYKVNVVIRSAKKSQSFLEQKYSSHVEKTTLRFTEIPDMTVPHVFDTHARTADAIIHIATPLAPTDFEHTMIQPTWTIDENILTAAAKSSKVKRVVITGTVASTVNMPQGLFRDGFLTERDWNTTTHEEGLQSMPNAYAYSKTNAEKQAWAFIEREKPDFQLVVLLAPLIIGKSIQHGYVPTKDSLGGMSNIYRAIFDVSEPGFIFPSFMYVSSLHSNIFYTSLPLMRARLIEQQGCRGCGNDSYSILGPQGPRK
jgi:nucleoside-diphosphate-sugar epimerase